MAHGPRETQCEKESMAEFEEETETCDEDEVTPEEKLQIVQHLLLSSPPGEFGDVLADTMALVPEDLVSRPMLAGIARAYNTSNHRAAKTEDGTCVMLCKDGEVDPTHYAIPSTGETVHVDHVALTAERVEGDPLPKGGFESERAAVDAAVSAYVSSRFTGDSKCSAVYERDAASELKVVLSGEQVNLRNFWSGNWHSEWTVVLGEGEALVSGHVKVRAHYFEDGNVQLQTTKQYDEQTVTFGSPEDLGKEVVGLVETAETELQKGLQDMYDNMSNETFKAMRRVMPITRTKMKWNIHEISLNRNLRK